MLLVTAPSMTPNSSWRFATKTTGQTDLPGDKLNRADAAAMAILILCMIAMFWKVLFTPAMLFFRDVYSYTYPHARFIQEACRRGALPYWNPYLNFGEPLLANPNFLLFYPYTLFIIVLPID